MTSFAALTLPHDEPLWPGVIALGIIATAVVWAYRGGFRSPTQVTCAILKVLGAAALCACLLEPIWTGHRSRPGANLFAIVADNSQSMALKDGAGSATRADTLKALLDPLRGSWQATLEDNFEVRRFAFDSRLQSLRQLSELTFEGRTTAMAAALRGIKERFVGRPLAGVLLFTDGNATDPSPLAGAASGLPPIYPVVTGRQAQTCDVSINQVNVTQTTFEDAPVTIQADVTTLGLMGERVTAELLDFAGRRLQETTVRPRRDSDTLTVNFKLRPEQLGVSFYRIKVGLRDEIDSSSPKSREATLLNNSRIVAVDRGGSSHRILYVAGRPNWEYKFLNRAVQEDAQMRMVALIRVALREAKFDFRGRGGETSNPLFRGFGNQSREDTERYDQPVLVRLNTKDELELRGGFPSSPEELFAYEAVVLDDVEAAFFTQDQAALLQRFVSERGGGLLMLGGMESFREGRYQRTPIGDMLPVYLDREVTAPPGGPVRLNLTREGWLQTWVRLRETEAEEKNRLATMPGFDVVNPVKELKPGASVIATASDEHGHDFPALVTQRFGHGRTAAFMIGDFWRWGMLNPETHKDMDKAWRQLLRWLVTDTPAQVDLTAEPAAESESDTDAMKLVVRARDARFQPLDDAMVTLEIQSKSGSTNQTATTLHLRAEPSGNQAGTYQVVYVPRQPGAYLTRAYVTNSLGIEVGRAEAGWTADPAAEEFRSLEPNLALLTELAHRTGGQVIEAGDLDDFTRRLPQRKAPVMESWTRPAWHSSTVFAFALACLAGEWGLRRWKGLP